MPCTIHAKSPKYRHIRTCTRAHTPPLPSQLTHYPLQTCTSSAAVTARYKRHTRDVRPKIKFLYISLQPRAMAPMSYGTSSAYTRTNPHTSPCITADTLTTTIMHAQVVPRAMAPGFYGTTSAYTCTNPHTSPYIMADALQTCTSSAYTRTNPHTSPTSRLTH